MIEMQYCHQNGLQFKIMNNENPAGSQQLWEV